jgi:hypothetical protein
MAAEYRLTGLKNAFNKLISNTNVNIANASPNTKPSLYPLRLHVETGHSHIKKGYLHQKNLVNSIIMEVSHQFSVHE